MNASTRARTAIPAFLLAMSLSACGSDTVEKCEEDCDSGLESPVRLIWFGTDYDGDPASAPNPHQVFQATAIDGVHFTDAVEIFSGDDLVDPDFFEVPDAAGGGYGLLWTNFADTNIHYAHSDTSDGTYESVGGALVSGGQTATLMIGDQLTTFMSGVRSFPLSFTNGDTPNAYISGGDAGITSGVIEAADLGYSSGFVADPSVVTMADGTYRIFVKYAAMDARPRDHEVWTLTSTDGATWASAEKLRDGASVPGAVLVNDTIFFYFVDFSGDYSTNNSLAVGYSSDNGETWEYSALYLDETMMSGAYDPAALPIE